MGRITLAVIALILVAGCAEKVSPITIVDIGHLDRDGIAKELKIINKYSPKMVALDFMLTTDSLAKDELLSTELSRVTNLVSSTILHGFDESRNHWDSLEEYHPKFGKSKSGFSNISATDDSVFLPSLPMRQYYKGTTVMALSYVIADNSFGVKTKYQITGDKSIPIELGASFKIIPVKDLLSEKFNKEDLNGKIVIMGYMGPDEHSFYLDRQRIRRMSGVEIQANSVNQLIRAD